MLVIGGSTGRKMGDILKDAFKEDAFKDGAEPLNLLM